MRLTIILVAVALVSCRAPRSDTDGDPWWPADSGDIDGGADGSEDATIDGATDSSVDGPAEDGGGDASSAPCDSCAAGQGCLRFELSRAADGSELPWIVWGGEADGIGTLVVGAFDAADYSIVVRESVANADLREADWATVFHFDCIPAGNLQARAFLDDNENDTEGGIQSSDYFDTCLDGRGVDVTVTPGTTAVAQGVMTRTCD